MKAIAAIVVTLTAITVSAPLPARATAHEQPDSANAISANSAPTSELAAQFRACRVALRDPATTQGAEMRAWAGPMHSVMVELGQRLGSEGPVREVISLLGEPDEVLPSGTRRMGLVVPAGCEFLVYWWRGGHDYLYFVVSHGQVQSSRWWYAGE